MIPVLMAEESLRRVTEIALGNGLVKEHDRQMILSGWRRDTRMGEGVKGPVTLDTLIGNGIGLVFVGKGESG